MRGVSTCNSNQLGLIREHYDEEIESERGHIKKDTACTLLRLSVHNASLRVTIVKNRGIAHD